MGDGPDPGPPGPGGAAGAPGARRGRARDVPAVLPSTVVRVGFLTHLLWDRYGPFWATLARAAGAEVVLPAPADVVARLTDPRVAAASAVAFRLAIGAALALEDVDLLVVPRLNPEDGGDRGAGQDPWVADLPTMLGRTVPGLPPLWPVPAELDRPVESAAVSFLRRLTPDAGILRRAWSQHRAEARPARRSAATTAAPAGAATIALVGQPWWATPAMATLFAGPDERMVGPYAWTPAGLRDEGRRLDPGLIDTDAEALGAVRRCARSATIARLRLVVDGGAGSDLWLARRAAEIAPRQLEVVDLRGQPEPERVIEALLLPAGRPS